MKIFKGILASPGIAIGKAYILNRFHVAVVCRNIGKDEAFLEVDRLNAAVEAVRKEMIKSARESVGNIPANMRDIFNPHIQILEDPTLIGHARQMVEKKLVNAEYALKETFDKFVQRFENIRDGYFKDRLHEIELVVNKLIRELMGAGVDDGLSKLNEPAVIFAHDLTPFDTAQMSAKYVLGFVTEAGGKTSHTGIIASSLNIPAVVGVPKILRSVETGDNVIVDAITGNVVIKPTDQQFQSYNQKRQHLLFLAKKMEKEAGKEARTRDGVLFRLTANIESPSDVPTAASHGAEGIGLYRTEFLFVRGNRLPDEEEQFNDYKKVAQLVAPYEAIIRTLDLGGDKMPGHMVEEPEANPALGLRAIRYCLDQPAVFRTQLRSILRASHYGRLRVMFPMVSSLEEFLRAKAMLERMKRELDKDGVPYDKNLKVGMMVETPSAALMVTQFAVNEVDFFSVGTNDLIQYLLAIDRTNQSVANLFEPLNPAVIRLLWNIIQSANRYKVPVSVCGKMSADPVYAYLLIGMGDIENLSMDSNSIPKLKGFLRDVSAEEARKHVLKVMEFDRVRDTKKYLTKNVTPMFSEGMFSELMAEDASGDA
ncbi:MAG: phosphoenolpyruvate--protein phosphotransferase [Nitrospinae bacterium]|nr:phosphoenolpyruvate--protein phosphotransferase [Nitrospinota bacterium]